jgi:hypothetical protein
MRVVQRRAGVKNPAWKSGGWTAAAQIPSSFCNQRTTREITCLIYNIYIQGNMSKDSQYCNVKHVAHYLLLLFDHFKCLT